MNRLQCRDHFLNILQTAAEDRPKRDRFVHDPFEKMDVLEWVIHERKIMLDEVNRFRSSKGLDVIDEKELLRVERMAVGHVDYARKFALCCAELTQGENGGL